MADAQSQKTQASPRDPAWTSSRVARASFATRLGVPLRRGWGANLCSRDPPLAYNRRVRTRRSWLCTIVVIAAVSGPVVGCDLLASSKVSHGQRYQSDDSRFDPYFEAVHEQQVAAASWPDERKGPRQRLIHVLALTPDANDDRILDAARARVKERGVDAPLASAIEDSARLESDRIRKLQGRSERLESMAKNGEELRRTASREYENRGAAKADEKKSAKLDEIRRELAGAIGVLRDLSRTAVRDAKDGQGFIDDMRSAIHPSEPSTHRRERAAPAPQRTPEVTKNDPQAASAEAPRVESPTPETKPVAETPQTEATVPKKELPKSGQPAKSEPKKPKASSPGDVFTP